MHFSYGWPEGQKNPAFRNRSLPLNEGKTCILVGRNGSGKTLASKILENARFLILGNFPEYNSSLNFFESIQLEWFEVDVKIPLVCLSEEGDGFRLSFQDKIAMDLISDGDEIWLSSTSTELIDNWDIDFHSFSTELNLKIRVNNLSTNPNLFIRYSLTSKGILEISTEEESVRSMLNNLDDHLGFSAHITSGQTSLEYFDLNFEKPFSISDQATIWKYIIIRLAGSSGIVEDLRNEYQKQLQYIAEQLNQQCISSGHGYPGVFDDDMEWFNPGEDSSTIFEILLKKMNSLFPQIVNRPVERNAPELDIWKKEILEEMLVLRKEITTMVDFKKFGLAGEMMLEVLNEFEELNFTKWNWNFLIEVCKSKSISNTTVEYVGHSQYFADQKWKSLEDRFKEYKEYEGWLDVLPLFIQQSKKYSMKTINEPLVSIEKTLRACETISQKEHEFLQKALYDYENNISEYVNYIHSLLANISECFPHFSEVQKTDDRYTTLIDSFSKFQQSDNIEKMYLEGINNSSAHVHNSIDNFAHKFDANGFESELALIIPRYMMLFWYAFEMDRDTIALFETYVRVIEPCANDLDSLPEFLHIIEDRNTLPSGFRHILSIIMGTTESDKECIYFVDEPEISLHICWQRKLVEHLQFCLNEFRNKSVLFVATHSPDIMLNHLEDIVNFSPQLID